MTGRITRECEGIFREMAVSYLDCGDDIINVQSIKTYSSVHLMYSRLYVNYTSIVLFLK